MNTKKQTNKIQMKGGEKMMKMIFRLFMVALLCLAFAGPASAVIKNSKHDFSTTSSYVDFSVSGETRMCVFCHTPHNAVENVPLWNRTVAAAGTYDLYTASATLTSAAKNSVIGPLNISYKCLSCHDGTVSIGGGAVQGTSTQMDADDQQITGANTRIAEGGSDLTDDHPIGFDFNTVGGNQDDKIRTLAVATGNGMKFYNAGSGFSNQMECASCHDVHGQSGATKFLRTNNAGSALCLSCHIK